MSGTCMHIFAFDALYISHWNAIIDYYNAFEILGPIYCAVMSSLCASTYLADFTFDTLCKSSKDVIFDKNNIYEIL